MISDIIISVVLLLNYDYVESDGTNPLAIAGGRITSIETHNFLVSVFITTDETTDYRCAGSLISSYYVITTAHCVYNIDELRILVHVGSSHPMLREGRTFRVDKIKQEGYNNETRTNDISLLCMHGGLAYYNKTIGSIILSTAKAINFTDETPLTVIGFDVKKNKLREAYLYIVNDTLCQGAYGITFVSQFCAKNARITLEVGDEGSPVVYNNKLIGIVSRTEDNVNQKGLTVLVKVANYQKFIVENM